MHTIFYYMLIYLLLGGAGMALANRKAGRKVRRQRWTKYFMYVAITAIVTGAIFSGLFYWIAIVIISFGLCEILMASLRRSTIRLNYLVFSVMVYIFTAIGFWKFAAIFNPPVLLFFYFQVFVFDGFCQVTGQLIGKHKLAPAISPSKTVEGLAGGWIFCILSAMLGADWVHGMIFNPLLAGILTGFTCFAGDMLGSYFKRLSKIKDYSQLLPGQGGFIDRFGSFMMTGMVYYFLYVSGVRV